MPPPRDAEKLEHEAGRLAECARGLLLQQHQEQRSTVAKRSSAALHLAHYTSLDAVVSILQTSGGGLRLSDSSTMSDPEEGRTTKNGRSLLRLLKDEFGQESWVWKRYGAAHICCFVGISRSEQPQGSSRIPGDDLLFWRLYGGNCRGVSISIPPHVCQQLGDSAFVSRVIYSDEPPLQAGLAKTEALLRELEDLRTKARDANLWSQLSETVLPDFDLLLAQRFLHKRPHYAMESEYRAIGFVTVEDGMVDGLDDGEGRPDCWFSSHGRHVSYGRVRTFVQARALSCRSIFTTGSQITIGSNVPDSEWARRALKRELSENDLAPGVAGVVVSTIPYRG